MFTNIRKSSYRTNVQTSHGVSNVHCDVIDVVEIARKFGLKTKINKSSNQGFVEKLKRKVKTAPSVDIKRDSIHKIEVKITPRLDPRVTPPPMTPTPSRGHTLQLTPQVTPALKEDSSYLHSLIRQQERNMTSHGGKIRTKVVGFDATVFDESCEVVAPPSTIETEDLSRYPNAFSPMRSPRGIHSNVIKELKPPEVLHGHTIPTTPWLLRRGESKEYGVRRQISADNKLQLSPDIHPREKSTMHFNTPAQGLTRSSTLPSTGNEDFSEVFTPDVENLNLTPHYHQLQPMAITNRLKNRSKKNATWVDCYKIKRDRNKLNNLLNTKGAIDPQVEKMLPAF